MTADIAAAKHDERIRDARRSGENAYLYRVPRERATLGMSDPTGELTVAFFEGYDEADRRNARY